MRFMVLAAFAAVLCASNAVAENALWIENGSALPGTAEVKLGLYATHDQAIHAFTAVVGYEENVFEFSRVELDGPGIVTGSVGYEYDQVLSDPATGNVVLAVLLDLESPFDFHSIPASPDQGQLLARFVFSVFPDANPGVYEVRLLRRSGGSPPIENVFTVRPGVSVAPDLADGEFTVPNPHSLSVLDSQALPGGVAIVYLAADHLDPIEGYQVVVRYPADLLTVEQEDPDAPVGDQCSWPITFCGLGLEDYLGTDGVGTYPIEFFDIDDTPAYAYDGAVPGTGTGRVQASAIFDYVDPRRDQMLPPGIQRILRIRFRTSGGLVIGDEVPLLPVNGTPDPRNPGIVVENTFVVFVPGQPDFSVNPQLLAGKIKIAQGFRRGRMNPSDNSADIGDAVYLLTYLFVRGPPVPCKDAADANDDGKLDIGDAIKLLGYLFSKQPAPPEPFRDCGGDPTPDNLGCETPVGC